MRSSFFILSVKRIAYCHSFAVFSGRHLYTHFNIHLNNYFVDRNEGLEIGIVSRWVIPFLTFSSETVYNFTGTQNDSLKQRIDNKFDEYVDGHVSVYVLKTFGLVKNI